MYLELEDEETASAYIAIIHAEETVGDSQDEEVEIGRRYRLTEGMELFVGSGIGDHIQLPKRVAAERQAKLFFQHGHWYVRNMRDDQYTYNEFDMITNLHPLKKDGEIFRVGKVSMKYFNGNGVESFFDKKNFARSRIDSLTKVYNRKYIFERLEDELSWFSRPGARQLSVLLFDLDHFKLLNDTYGHLCGDKALKVLCERIAARLRKHEKLGRYGGEEFLVVMPAAGLEKAVRLAEELRSLLADQPLEYEGQKITLTASIGVAAVEKTNSSTETVDTDLLSLVTRADEKLYEAKRTGRNRVCF